MAPQAGSTAQLLWSYPMLSSMQQQARTTAQMSLCSLSAVSMSVNRQNVAAHATLPDGRLVLQLLSVSINKQPEELSTHVLNLDDADKHAAGTQQSKWCCCYSRSGEVMLWKAGRSVYYKWALQTGASVCLTVPKTSGWA